MLEFDQARQIAHRVLVRQLMDRAHFVNEHGRTERLVRHALVTEYRLNLVLPSAQRNDDVRVIVQMKVLNLAWKSEANMPRLGELAAPEAWYRRVASA